MSDKVQVAYSDTPAKVANSLLDAAEELGLDAGVVETTSDNVFLVPKEVAEKAGIEVVEADEEQSVNEDGVRDYEDLKGKALDEELKARDLTVEGKVAEKRQALIDDDAIKADSEDE